MRAITGCALISMICLLSPLQAKKVDMVVYNDHHIEYNNKPAIGRTTGKYSLTNKAISLNGKRISKKYKYNRKSQSAIKRYKKQQKIIRRRQRLISYSKKSLIIRQINITANRYANHPALRKSGLNNKEWNALFRALIERESAYNPRARSNKGAMGLGQLMPGTAKYLGVKNAYDIKQNLDGSARYLLEQLGKFKRADYALGAYNAGPHRIYQYKGIPPYRETKAYVRIVLGIKKRLLGYRVKHKNIPVIRRASKKIVIQPTSSRKTITRKRRAKNIRKDGGRAVFKWFIEY